MKKWLILIGIIVFSISSFFVIRYFSDSTKDYVYTSVERKDVVEYVSESGNISSSGNTGIYSSTNGIVDKVYVKNGDTVADRQKLFSVKSTATSQERSQAYAQYESAKAAVRQAESTRRATIATVDRVHDDVKDHDKDETFIQKETRTAAEVANDNAYDALLAAQAQLVSAQTNYYATLNSIVYAPIKGNITNLSINPGSSVSINSILTTVTPALVINTQNPTEFVTSIGETEINKIMVGQKATIKLDAIENKIYQAEVQRYDSFGSSTQGATKFNVYLTITNPDESIKPGMNGDVDITTKEEANVLTVPNTALKPYQKGRAVRMLNNKKEIEYLPVTIGIKGKEYSQIIDGVTDGQKIILSLPSEKAPKSTLF